MALMLLEKSSLATDALGDPRRPLVKLIQVFLLTLAITGVAFAGDVPATPEIGVDGPTIVGAVGLLTGVLVIMRARKK
jgi:hypothetical protein